MDTVAAGRDAADLDRVGECSNICSVADLIENCCCKISSPCYWYYDLVAIVKIGLNTVYNGRRSKRRLAAAPCNCLACQAGKREK